MDIQITKYNHAGTLVDGRVIDQNYPVIAEVSGSIPETCIQFCAIDAPKWQFWQIPVYGRIEICAV